MIQAYPKLSICILTYNRKEHLSRILEFIKSEYESITSKHLVEIIISDNHSSDGTHEVIIEFIKNNSLNEWKFNRNPQNIGPIGNLLKSKEISSGEYFWWMGDDDYYKKGILKAVLNYIDQNPDYILLNHGAFRKYPWDGSVYINAFENWGLINPRIEDIIRKSPGILMFISTSIYRKQILENLKSYNFSVNLALPLLYSLTCAANGKYIIDEKVWVDDNHKDISWGDESFVVFNKYIPYYISLMPKLGYDRSESKAIYKELYSGLWKKKTRRNIIRILDKTHCLNLAKQVKHLFK